VRARPNPQQSRRPMMSLLTIASGSSTVPANICCDDVAVALLKQGKVHFPRPGQRNQEGTSVRRPAGVAGLTKIEEAFPHRAAYRSNAKVVGLLRYRKPPRQKEWGPIPDGHRRPSAASKQFSAASPEPPP
jgi:hypothetical protein